MALESIKNINIDLYDDKYILINAKQYDNSSRKIYATCYNQGKILNINSNGYTVYIKYQKADGHFVFNFCTINSRGQIIIELTEQMLAASGTCYADLVIVEKGNAVVNITTGEIDVIDNSSIVSTMNFRVYVYESPIDNSVVESSDEYDGLVDLLKRAEAEYSSVINTSESWAINSQSYAVGGTDTRDNENEDNSKSYCLRAESAAEKSEDNFDLSKSYAVGGTGVRSGEDTDNSMYYYELASVEASNANNSANIALQNNEESYRHSVEAQSYAVGGTDTRDNENEDNALYYQTLSKSYAIGNSYIRDNEDTDNSMYYCQQSEKFSQNADKFAYNAENSMQETLRYKEEAFRYFNDSKRYAVGEYEDDTDNSKYYSKLSKSYTVGGTDIRFNENVDNAKYYYEQLQGISEGFGSVFKPMGTITFSELLNINTDEIEAGYLYNINESFTTNDSFKGGAGNEFVAGTNVYRTADNYWDCLYGSDAVYILVTDIATVDEVKDFLGI